MLIPGKLVLKTTTDPTGLELGKVTDLVNLHSKDPTPGGKIDVAIKFAVREPHGVIVQVTLELFQLSSASVPRVLFCVFGVSVPALILSCLVNQDANPSTSKGTNEGT